MYIFFVIKIVFLFNFTFIIIFLFFYLLLERKPREESDMAEEANRYREHFE